MVIDKAGVLLYHPSFVHLTTVNERHVAELVNLLFYFLKYCFYFRIELQKCQASIEADLRKYKETKSPFKGFSSFPQSFLKFLIFVDVPDTIFHKLHTTLQVILIMEITQLAFAIILV